MERPHARKLNQSRAVIGMLLLLAVLLIPATTARAPLRIVGTVQDSTGGVIPNARVVLKDSKTGITKEVTSTERGTFLFPDLPSGLYEVTVTAPGFRTALLNNISVSTNQTTDVRISMEVGATSETITVSGGDAQTLETSSQ